MNHAKVRFCEMQYAEEDTEAAHHPDKDGRVAKTLSGIMNVYEVERPAQATTASEHVHCHC
jgi:hypothetical protein